MDQELKLYLDEMKRETREQIDDMRGQIEGVKHETRQQMDDLRGQIEGVKHEMKLDFRAQKQYMDDIERRLKLDLREQELRLREHTEIVETRLLTEFWKWARTADARYRQHHSSVNGLDERVQIVKDRISELEPRKPS